MLVIVFGPVVVDRLLTTPRPFQELSWHVIQNSSIYVYNGQTGDTDAMKSVSHLAESRFEPRTAVSEVPCALKCKNYPGFFIVTEWKVVYSISVN